MSLHITCCRFCQREIYIDDSSGVDSCREFIKYYKNIAITGVPKYCEQELEQIALKCDSEAISNRVEFV